MRRHQASAGSTALRSKSDIKRAELYAEEGHYDKAADTVLLIIGNIVSQQSVQDAARLLRQAPAKVAPELLPDLDAGLTFVYGSIGAYEVGLKNSAERALALGLNVGAGGAAWYPSFAPFRKTERFKDFVRRAGLVDFWKARGWPDLCHPVGADDFACN